MPAARIFLQLIADFVVYLGLLIRPRKAIAAENLFLRRQLALYQERKVDPRRIDPATRITLALLSTLFNWRDVLIVVQPKTLIRWHRTGFRLLWNWKSKPGRPPIPAQLRRLIREMSRDNSLWGEERIANELLKISDQLKEDAGSRHGIAIMPQIPSGFGQNRGILFLRRTAFSLGQMILEFLNGGVTPMRLMSPIPNGSHGSIGPIHVSSHASVTPTRLPAPLLPAQPNSISPRFLVCF